MNLTKEMVEQAAVAGLELTNPDSDLLDVFRKHSQGILLMRAILTEILGGKIALSPAVEKPRIDENTPIEDLPPVPRQDPPATADVD